MNNHAITIQGLSRRFGKKQALDRIDLMVPEGIVLGLVGENGAGKTTLIMHLLGLLKAQMGHVRVFNLDPVADPVGVLGRIGYLSENRDMPEWMRIHELIRYKQAFHPGWNPDYAQQLLETFELDPHQKIKTLSRGQRAKAGLLIALAHRPALLVFDEPSSGLDPIVRRDILEAIVRTIAEEGRTVVFSSHLLDEIERVSDRVVMIHEGRIVLTDSLDAIKASHHQLVVRFSTAQQRAPCWPGVLSCAGGPLDWTILCHNHTHELDQVLPSLDAQVVERAVPSLDDIFKQCFGVSTFPLGMPKHPWTPPPALHPLMLGVGIAGAFGLAAVGVARDRCGDRLSLALIKLRRRPGRASPVKLSRNFRSPIAAQCWFERRRIGRFIPCFNLFMVTFILVLGISGLLGTRTTEVCATLFCVLAVVNLMVYPPMLGIGFGQQGGRQLTVDPFKAIQPLSNATLLWIYLRSALETILVGWMIYFAGMLVVLTGLFIIEGREAVDLFFATLRVLSQAAAQPGSPWYGIRFVISLRGMGSVCMWSAFALIASVLLTGRHWFLNGLFTLCWGVILWGFLCDFGLIPQAIMEGVRNAQPWFIGLGCLGGTVAAFIMALRKSIINRIMPWAGLGIWAILCVLGVYGDILPLASPIANLVLVGGLLILPVAPLALAPLALHWNRHR
jgi:ABC-2 type transport system ATP-binding protein